MGLEAYRLTIRQHTNAPFGTEVEQICSVAAQHRARRPLHTATAVGGCAASLPSLDFTGKGLTGNVRFSPKRTFVPYQPNVRFAPIADICSTTWLFFSHCVQRLFVALAARSISELFKLHSLRTVKYRSAFSLPEKKGLGLFGMVRSLSNFIAASS